MSTKYKKIEPTITAIKFFGTVNYEILEFLKDNSIIYNLSAGGMFDELSILTYDTSVDDEQGIMKRVKNGYYIVLTKTPKNASLTTVSIDDFEKEYEEI